eukprot:4703419-Lingulodinium_polyedra.AAC.1
MCIRDRQFIARPLGSRALTSAIKDELLLAMLLLPLMSFPLRLLVSGLVTCSDSSLSHGAVCRSVAVPEVGLAALKKRERAGAVQSRDE